MGHFSYSCQLSGVPITAGNECVIVPMLPRKHFFDNSEEHYRKFGTSVFVSNEGENLFFQEFCFPIFGTYDEYGGMDNIVKDDNTEVLEEFFQLKIDKIVEVICSGRKDEFEKGGEYCASVKILKKDNPEHMLLLQMSAIWLDKKVYDQLIISYKNNKKNYFDKLDIGIPSVLKSVGFTFTGKVKKERYNLAFEKDGLTIHSDGNWINVKNESIYNLKDLQKYCAKKKVNIDISAYDSKGIKEQIYDYLIPDLENLKETHDRWTTERVIHLLLGDEYKMAMHGFEDVDLEELKAVLAEVKEGKSDEKRKKFSDSIKNPKRVKNTPKLLTPLYFSKIKEKGNDFLKKNILDWFAVKGFYYPLGRYLIPIGTSPQDGDYEKVKMFYSAVDKALEEHIDYRKEKGYYDDEDDDDE